MLPREEKVVVIATSEFSREEVFLVTLISTLMLCQALPWCVTQTLLSSHMIIVRVSP